MVTPTGVRARRLELGLTEDEFAFALNISEAALRRIEAGNSETLKTAEFNEAFDSIEERAFGLLVGV